MSTLLGTLNGTALSIIDATIFIFSWLFDEKATSSCICINGMMPFSCMLTIACLVISAAEACISRFSALYVYARFSFVVGPYSFTASLYGSALFRAKLSGSHRLNLHFLPKMDRIDPELSRPFSLFITPFIKNLTNGTRSWYCLIRSLASSTPISS